MKQCAFCLRPAKMTGEHIWSDWIGGLYSDFKGKYSFEIGINPSNGPARKWSSHKIDMTAKVVCEPCNNGWMSDLDAEAQATMKDMIRNAAYISLLPRGIATIAAFAFKTAVISDSVTPNRYPFFSHSERKRFSTNLTIPETVRVSLASFRGTHFLNGRFQNHYAKIAGGRFKGFELYVFTFVAGFLVVQLSAARWVSTIIKRPRFFPKLVQGEEWKVLCVPLWPSDDGPVVWPPPLHLNSQSIDTLTYRWNKIVDRSSP